VINFANFHAGQTHLRSFAQAIRIRKPRTQVQMAFKRVQFSRRVQNQHNEHRQGDENEQANAQLAQSDVPG
jgi:hypothetical protein